MASKLTRCLCGKIFDPAEHSLCPSCGAEPRHEVQAAPTPAEPAPAKTELRVTNSEPLLPPKPAGGGGERKEIHVSFTVRQLVQYGGGALAAIALTAFGWWYWHRPPDEIPKNTVAKIEDQTGKVNSDAGKKTEPKNNDVPLPQPQTEPQPKPTPTPTPTPAPAEDPSAPKTRTVEHKGSDEESGALLVDAISKAAAGDTIVVRGSPFVVDEGLVLSRPVHLVGDDAGGAPSEIRSGHNACITVAAKGVVIEKLRLTQTGESGTAPTVTMKKDAELTLTGCLLTSRISNVLTALKPASVTATDCGFACLGKDPAGIPTIAIMAGGRVSFSRCEFAGGLNGLALAQTPAELLACKFHDSGTPDGKGAALNISGAGETAVTAENCEFTNNRCAIHVSDAELTVKGGKFSNNGIAIEGAVQTEGILVVRKAKAFINGATFTSNQQGVMVLESGRAEVTDCHFTGNGQKTENLDYGFFCHDVGVAGKQASALLRGCDFAKGEYRAACALQGAQITMDNCKFADGSDDIFTVGRGAAAEVRHCKFSGFARGGIVVYGQGSATFEDVEMRQNKLGIEVRETGTRVQCSKVIIADNTAVGVAVYDHGSFTGTDCTFENNPSGLQVGQSGKPENSAVAMLENCKLLNNLKADATAGQQSRLTLTNCSFAPDAEPKIFREKGATITAEPPIEGIVDTGPGTAKKGSSTASNNKGSTSKGRSTPSSNRPAPRDPVREIINSVERMRRMFR